MEKTMLILTIAVIGISGKSISSSADAALLQSSEEFGIKGKGQWLSEEEFGVKGKGQWRSEEEFGVKGRGQWMSEEEFGVKGNGVWESEESSQEQVWRSNEDEVAGKGAWDIEEEHLPGAAVPFSN